MLNKIKSNAQITETNHELEQQEIHNLGMVNQTAANASDIEHTKSVERRLRRDRREHRSAVSSFGLWRASIG